MTQRKLDIQTYPNCPFCLENDALHGDILYQDDLLYFVTGEKDGHGMIITKRHIATPFEINTAEWARLHELLPKFKSFIDKYGPHGYNLGWNVGVTGGQNVMHAHLHIFGRYDNEPLAGKGIRHAFKQQWHNNASDNTQ